MGFKTSLKNYLMTSYIFITLIPISIISIITIYFLFNHFTNDINTRNTMLANALSDEVEYFLTEPVNIIKELKNIISANDLIEEGKIGTYLDVVLNNYPYFDSIQILDNKGDVKFISPNNSELMGLNMSNETFYINTMQQNRPCWSPTFVSLQTGHPTITLSLPIKGGMAVGYLDLSKLGNSIDVLSIGTKSYVGITDEKGVFIAHTIKNYVYQRDTEKYMDEFIRKSSGSSSSFIADYYGDRMLISIAFVKSTNWPVVIYQSVDEAFAPVNKIRYVFILGIILFLVISIFLSLKSIQRILYPVTQLSMKMDKVRTGQYIFPLSYSSYSEFNDLAEHFNNMIFTIQLRENDLRKTGDELEKLNKTLEQRIQERTSLLEAANKELEMFSYSVSHDLKAPLRAIDGFSRIILEDYQDHLDQEGRRYLNVIRKNTKHMGQLIDDLLAFSRMSRAHIDHTAINMTGLANSVYDELAALNPERSISFNLEPLPPAYGDIAMIRQVLVNLLSNAVKFTRKTEHAIIHMGCTTHENKNVYFIKDNGVGFDMKYSSKLFGVFQRLHTQDEFEGTGVGLAIVQRIIHRHKGLIWFESEVGVGTAFYFTLNAEEI